MLTYLIILFTVIPALELYVLLTIGASIGPSNTFLIIILTGIIGASLARWQGFVVFRNIQQELNRGLMPSHQLLDGLMILVAGIVLLTPGFITDAFGFLLLIPWFRALLKAVLRRKFEQMIQDGQRVTFHSSSGGRNGYDDIDIT